MLYREKWSENRAATIVRWLDNDVFPVINERHGLNIPYDELCDYEFGMQFLNLFAYDLDIHDMTGHRRVNTIISCLYYDKNKSHLQFKLDLEAQEIAFMVNVITQYKFKCNLPRENTKYPDPELTVHFRLEDAIYDH